ncbi:ankyrin repeat [Stylonychia lemnae]|uniref:Ankyrin repeat n=1 Tax=Stylonychia lemnae TaxID=5949 RepID=A0A078A5Q6_STYLE|nr:ankyrin repeat [Stylonychia lemnae]|eukprot:CDW77519.1 ankyrin repeat [Stylonychia lemnae]
MENIKTQSQFFQRRIDHLQINSKQPVLSNYESQRRGSQNRNLYVQGDSKIDSQVTTDSTSSLQVSGQNQSHRYNKKQQSLFGTHLNIPTRVNISPLTLSTEYQPNEQTLYSKAPNLFHISPSSSPQITRPQLINEYNEPFRAGKNGLFKENEYSQSHHNFLNKRISIMTKSSENLFKQKMIYLNQFKKGGALTPNRKYREKLANHQKSSKDRISGLDSSGNLNQEQFPPQLKKELQNIGKINRISIKKDKSQSNDYNYQEPPITMKIHPIPPLNQKLQSLDNKDNYNQNQVSKIKSKFRSQTIETNHSSALFKLEGQLNFPLAQPSHILIKTAPLEQKISPKFQPSSQDLEQEQQSTNVKNQLEKFPHNKCSGGGSSTNVSVKKHSSNKLIGVGDEFPSRKVSNQSLSNQVKNEQKGSQNNLGVNKLNLIRRTTVTSSYINTAFRSMRTTGRESQTRKIELFQKATEIKSKYNKNYSFDESENDSDSIGSIKSDTDSDAKLEKDLLRINLNEKIIKGRKPSIARRGSTMKDMNFGFGNEFSNNVIFESVIRNDFQQLQDQLNSLSSQFERVQKLNQQDKFLRTPIFYAIYHNNYEMVNFLLNQGSDTLFIDNMNRTILHYICILGLNRSILQLILDFNNNLDFENAHTEEAYKLFLNKPVNSFDMPQRNINRISRPQLKIEIDNLGSANSIKKNRYDDIQVTIPEPMTSLLPKKKKMLDSSKLSVIKDDRSESNLTISNKNETTSDKLRDSNGKIQTISLASPCDNQLMASRRISSLKGIGRSGSSITPRSSSNINGSAKKSSLSSQLGEERTKINNEINIKKNKNYIKMMKKFINICDKQGKSALAYAAQKSQIGLVKILLERGAVPITRDYKSRKPIDLATCDDLLSLLSQQEALFDEKFSDSLKTFRKNLIADEHQRLRSIQQQKMGRDILLTFTDVIKEQKEDGDDQDSIMEQQHQRNKPQQKMSRKDIGRRMTKKMQMNKAELASWSDKLLLLYHIGIYKDNALTYKMRFEDKENFQYLLKRGISVLCTDKNGNNILHYAIQLEKIEFLSYLLEGSFQSEIYEKSLGLSADSLFDLYIHQKAKELSANLRTGQFPWIQDSLYALEKSNDRDGNNSLHMAVDIGNHQLFCYIVTMLKIRDHMRFMDKNRYMKLYNSYECCLEFKNKHQQTPLLYSAKRNQYKIFQELLVQGAQIYVQCSKFMNILHYAVLNENKNLIEQIVYCDAETDRLLNEKNYRNLTPLMIDDKKKYEDIFNHIWSSVAICSPSNLEHLEHLITNDKFTVNQKTLIGQNSPLHIAVINENFKAIEHLCKYRDINLHDRNSLGQTPKDLALLIPKKRTAAKIIDYLNKRISQIQQREKGNLSPAYSKTQTILKKSTFNKKSAAVRLGTIGKNSFQIIPQQTEQNNPLPQQSEQTFNSINFSAQIKNLVEQMGKVIIGIERSNSNMGRKASALSLDSSEKSDDYFEEESSVGSNLYLASQTSILMENDFKSNPNGRNPNWEPHKIFKLQKIFDNYLELSDLIGNFNPQIFQRWRAQLTKIDDTIVIKSKEIFKQTDERKRGYITLQQIYNKKQLLLDSKIMEEIKLMKLLDQLDKQYQDTKITESKFVQLILDFAIKKDKVVNPAKQLKESGSADSVQLFNKDRDTLKVRR